MSDNKQNTNTSPPFSGIEPWLDLVSDGRYLYEPFTNAITEAHGLIPGFKLPTNFENFIKKLEALGNATTSQSAVATAYASVAAWNDFYYSSERDQQHIKPLIDDIESIVLPKIRNLERDTLLCDLKYHLVNDYSFQSSMQGVSLSIAGLQSEVNKTTQEVRDANHNLTERSVDLYNKVQAELDRVKKLYDETTIVLKDMKDEVSELYRVVTKDALTVGYAVQAATERKTANQFRKAAIFFMFVLAAVAGFFFYEAYDAELSISGTIIRAITLAIISAPVAYFAKESNRHRTYENHYQQTALDIAGAPPWLSILDKPNKDKTLAELALRLFNRPAPSSTSSTSDLEVKDILLRMIDKNDTKHKAGPGQADG